MVLGLVAGLLLDGVQLVDDFVRRHGNVALSLAGHGRAERSKNRCQYDVLGGRQRQGRVSQQRIPSPDRIDEAVDEAVDREKLAWQWAWTAVADHAAFGELQNEKSTTRLAKQL